MSLVAQIAKNTAYQTFGKFFSALAGLITIGLMTRYLGQTGFGHYTTAVAFLQFFGVMIDFGLQMTATQMLAAPGSNQAKIFANILSIRFFSAVVFLGLAAVLGWLMPYPLIVKQAIALMSLAYLFTSLQSVFISIYQNQLAMRRVAVAEISNRLILLAGVATALYLEQGLLYIIVATILGNLINFALIFHGALKYFAVGLDFDFKLWKKIWHNTWPLALTIALTLVYFRADTIILSVFRSAEEVGLYGAPYKVLEILIQLPYLFLGLMLPIFTRLAENKNLFNLAVKKTFDFFIIIALPMIASLIILGPKVMIFIAGADFAVSGELIKILILATGAIFLGALFGYAIVAQGLQKKMVKFYLIDAAISLILYWLLIPVYSYWAAAWLTVATELFITVSAFFLLRRHTDLRLGWQISAKALAASLVMAAILQLLISQNLFTLIIIGLIIYFWLLYIFKGLDKATVLEIIQRRQ